VFGLAQDISTQALPLTPADTAVDPFDLTDCTSIDASADGDGQLAAFRQLYAAKPPGIPEGFHPDTKTAIANLLAPLAAGRQYPSLIGHGDPGICVTGGGQLAHSPDKLIQLAFENYWKDDVRKLRDYTFSKLTVLSCWTGSEDLGADLLYRLANLIHRPVRARTGYVSCVDHSVFFETGSTWQTAQPGTRPATIWPPSVQLLVDNWILLPQEEAPQLRTHRRHRFTKFLKRFVTSVDVYSSAATGPGAQTASLTPSQTASLLRLIDFSHPRLFRGAPLAVVSNYLRLNAPDAGLQPRLFALYGNRLLGDQTTRGIYYPVAPAIRTFLKTVLSQK